jgi:hypothetical protein
LGNVIPHLCAARDGLADAASNTRGKVCAYVRACTLPKCSAVYRSMYSKSVSAAAASRTGQTRRPAVIADVDLSLLSTLKRYVEAMGGKLNLVATLPNRPPVIIEQIAEPRWCG